MEIKKELLNLIVNDSYHEFKKIFNLNNEKLTFDDK